MDPDTIWNAIYGQESNSGQDNRTSMTGAVGPGQIQPGTWAQYAQPGENIHNNKDNIAVSKRIVQDYYNKYNGDPARIATAYFSGPGNVSPADSPTPYIKDRADPTGKKTSSYASDISGRLSVQQSAQDAINKSLGIKSDPISTALGYTDQPDGSTFTGAGLTLPPTPATTQPGALFGAAGLKVPAVSATPQATQPGALFGAAGLKVPTASDKSNYVTEPDVYRTPDGVLHITIKQNSLPIPVPGSPEFAQQQQQQKDYATAHPQSGILQSIREATNPVTVAQNLLSAVNQSSLEANSAARDLRQSGQSDLHNANLFPSFPSIDPSTWTGGGLLKTGVGAVGQFTAPITGAVNALVANPVTQATGNPDIGDRAAFLASTLLPVPKGASAIKNQLAPARAIDTIVRTVGPENVPALVSSLRSSSRLTPMDVNDSLRQLGQGLISNPAYPSVQKPLLDMVKNRVATAPEAINSAYTKTMGAAPDVVKMVQGLKDKAAEVGKQMIEPALENAKPIAVKDLTRSIDRAIASPEALAGETPKIPLNPTQIRLLNLRKQITSGEMAPLNERAGLGVGPINEALKTGGMSAERAADFTEARRLLNSARRGNTSEEDLVAGLKKLADKQKIVGPIDSALKMIQKGPTEYRGADFVHGIQSRLREEAESLSRSSSGAERLMGHDLFEARDKLVSKIDEAAGGAYRPGLAKYREAKQIDDAWESGFDTLKNRSGVNGLEDRPEALREWMKNATPEQIVAKRLGTRADIDQKIRGVKNQSLAGTSITKIEYNQEKLKDLFGEKEGSRLIRNMEDAHREAETNAKLVAGSKTAETLAGQKALEVRQVGKGNPLGYLQYAAPLAAEGLNFEVGHGVLPPGVATAGILAAKGVHLGLQKVGQMRDIAKNNAFARALSALGPEREQVINRLMSHPAVVRQLKKSSNALSVP